MREVSGCGLAVCDHIDATDSMQSELWLFGVLLSPKLRRAFIRESTRIGDTFASVVKAAMD